MTGSSPGDSLSGAPHGGPPSAGPLLCVETSCDDTSAAVVQGREVLSSIVSSQNELHAQFGGVVRKSPPAATPSS